MVWVCLLVCTVLFSRVIESVEGGVLYFMVQEVCGVLLLVVWC